MCIFIWKKVKKIRFFAYLFVYYKIIRNFASSSLIWWQQNNNDKSCCVGAMPKLKQRESVAFDGDD